MTRPSYRLLAEVGVDLAMATLALRLRPFETVMARIGTTDADAIDPAEAKMLARALRAWDRRLPWRTRCFEQGLAAMRYLARHGHAATLHYGARGAGQELEAHVWVTSGGVDVVGTENAADFRVLSRFPRA